MATTGLLIAASVAAPLLVACLSAAIDASVMTTPEPAVESAGALPEDCQNAALEPLGTSERTARCPIGHTSPVGARADEPDPSTVPDARARAASLAVAIDPGLFHMASFEIQARALARTLDPDATRDLARLAADGSLAPAERVAVAAILRHSPLAERSGLPESALVALRDAWTERESDATLAAAAVGSLAAFGDPEDRRAMLDSISTQSTPATAALACAGLSAARGDRAALEIASAAADDADPRRSEIAASALTAIATAGDRDLSETGRSRCAEALLRALAVGSSKDRSSARTLSALAALDADSRARPR